MQTHTKLELLTCKHTYTLHNIYLLGTISVNAMSFALENYIYNYYITCIHIYENKVPTYHVYVYMCMCIYYILYTELAGLQSYKNKPPNRRIYGRRDPKKQSKIQSVQHIVFIHRIIADPFGSPLTSVHDTCVIFIRCDVFTVVTGNGGGYPTTGGRGCKGQ